MLMDLFFASAPIKEKRRAHFHEFMSDVHGRLALARREEASEPVIAVGQAIAAEARLLCLDELFVIDIADATILNRLFGVLFETGTVVVATSNVHPSDLYKDGRNRDLFLPFIDLVEENMEVLQLEAAKDYRLNHLRESQLYFTPADAKAQGEMDKLWSKLTFGERSKSDDILVLGRTLHVPSASPMAARFTFASLFEQPFGADDYLALTRHYPILFVDGVPVMDQAHRDAARRFITFVDTLYDNHGGLVISAETEPARVYTGKDGADHFQRTASRLVEMRTESYLAASLNRFHSAGRSSHLF